MTVTRATFLTLLFSFCFFLQAQDVRFLNLDCNITKDEKPTHVKARVPLSVFEALRPSIEKGLQEAHSKETFKQFAQAWEEIKDIKDANLLEIESPELNFTMKIENDLVKINFNKDQKAGVITIPTELGDLFFAEQLDFDKLMASLRNFEGRSFVNVESEEINVQIWVD